MSAFVSAASREYIGIPVFIPEFRFFVGNGAATDVLSALLHSDVTSDITAVSGTLVDTSIDGIVTSDFNFLALLRGKFAPIPPLLAFSNASILLTAFDTLIDEDVLMKLLLLFVWVIADDDAVTIVSVVVEEDVSDVRFAGVSASMSAVILTVCFLFLFVCYFRSSFVSSSFFVVCFLFSAYVLISLTRAV